MFAGGSAWALLWLLIAAPTVFVSQILLTLLVRARTSVRMTRAVAWRDVIGLGIWHVVIVALGFYDSRAFFALLASASAGRR
ncbi:MAG: permease of the major facilitator superfamily [Microbacterium sp.]|nr:permease of the major facilitator superfamily [Microbacterium sp.]